MIGNQKQKGCGVMLKKFNTFINWTFYSLKFEMFFCAIWVSVGILTLIAVGWLEALPFACLAGYSYQVMCLLKEKNQTDEMQKASN
jgi:hypothetical protein